MTVDNSSSLEAELIHRPGDMQSFTFGVIAHNHMSALKAYIFKLVNAEFHHGQCLVENSLLICFCRVRDVSSIALHRGPDPCIPICTHDQSGVFGILPISYSI